MKRASKVRRLRVLWSPIFLISVLLPVAVAGVGVYYGLIASDISFPVMYPSTHQ